MKVDPGGQPDVTAQVPSRAGSAGGGRQRLGRGRTIAVVVVLAFIAVVIGRHVIVGAFIARSLSILSGERVSFDAFVVGPAQSVFRGVTVRDTAGELLVRADQVALRYSLHDAMFGGRHRYGLEALAVDRPTVRIVRTADGAYELPLRRAGGGGSGQLGGGVAGPFDCALRVRDGTLILVDRAPVMADLAHQTVRAIELEAHIDSERRSVVRGSATFLGGRFAGDRARGWPLVLTGRSDLGRGYAALRVRAIALPLRGPLAFIQHSGAMRLDAGILHGLQVNLYALNFGLPGPLTVRLGGRADVSDGELTFAALRRPVRGLHGRLILTDDGLWSTRLAGTLGGFAIAARGGAFDRLHPTLRLGIAADTDLHVLRTIFGFSQKQPVSGPVRVETLIEAPIANLLIRSALRIPAGRYGKIPLDAVAGRIDYHRSTVVLDGVRGRYGPATLGLGARFLLGGPALDSAIAVTADAPGRALPYAENIAPEATVEAAALISGGVAGYRAGGAIGLRAGGTDGAGVFAVDERGVGEFGPFAFTRGDGSTLSGALRLERPTSRSAAWLAASGYRVDVPPRATGLPGLTLPAFPPLAGRIDAALVGGGAPDAFGLAGQIGGTSLRIGNAGLGRGSARLGGLLRDVRIAAIGIDGPIGRFRGTAAYADGTLGVRGDYAGTLDQLVPLTGRQFAHGGVRGPVLATLRGADVVVSSAGAQLRGGRIRGVALDSATGTLAVRHSAFELIAADGEIGRRRAVARQSGDRIAVSAPDLPSAALRGTGLPLDAGNLSVYGLADVRGRAPSFTGTVAVAAGRARGYRVSGDARIDVTGSLARISAATGALGSTFGSINGVVAGIGERALSYDLQTRVPLGDIDLLRRDLNIPVRNLAGTFAADLRINGSGTRPVVTGAVSASEGVFNGLSFRDAAARLLLDADGVAARAGRLTVGSTRTTIAASFSQGRFGVALAAPRADLADFDDYFDSGDALAGHGGVALAFRTYGDRITSAGSLDLGGLRVGAFPLGDTRANWHMQGASIVSGLAIASAAGDLSAAGRLTPAASSDPMRAFRDANYHLHADVRRFDLGTWLPAAGLTQPILGTVDAGITLAGRLPRLAVGVDATLRDAQVAGLPIPSGVLRARSLGSRITVSDSQVDLGFARLSGSGSLGLAATDPLAFDVRATTPDVGPALRTFVPALRGRDLAGALDADVRVGGRLATPTVAGGFDLSAARSGAFSIPRAIGSVALAGRAIELRDADVEFSRGQAFVAGSLPLQLDPFGLGPAAAPVSFDVTARGVDLAQFNSLLPTGTKLGGTVDGRFGVEGTVTEPRLLGSLAIANGSYVSAFERAPIQAVNARLAFSGTSIALDAFHAQVGGGTLDAGGNIVLPFGIRPQTRFALDVNAKSVKLDFPAYGRGTLDGALRLDLSGGAPQPVLAGTIALRDAVIPVAAVYGSAASGAGGAGSARLPVDPALAIRASAGDNVRVRNAIVDVGVKGGVDVSGRLSAPLFAGLFSATDGTVSSYNHVFRIVNATAAFNPADGALPTIDARATSRVTNPDPDPSRNIAGSANITVTVSGTPDSNNLQVSYSSDPAYSQAQIVGLLLDVPALLGAVNFNLNGGPGTTLLRGAPGETNALLPPGVTPEQVSAISFNQEVFSLLNGQITQRALTPVERIFQRDLGLSDLEFTVDYGGGIGYSVRRQIGKRDFYAFLSQTVTYPERSNFGFELEPKPFETLNFSYYQQNGITSLITNQTPGIPYLTGANRYVSVQPLGNRSGFSLNFNHRF